MSQDEPIKIAPTAPQPNTEQLEPRIRKALRTDKRADTYVIPQRVMDVIVETAAAWNKATVQQAVKAAFEVHHQQYPDCPPKLLSKEQADE